MSHGITWDQVRAVKAADLVIGDTIVTPGMGTMYHVSPDGTVRPFGLSFELDGIAWVITRIENGKITTISHTGKEATEPLPSNPNKRVLIKARD